MNTKKIKILNKEIYLIAEQMIEVFDSSKYLPVKVNFAIQKNFKILTELAQEINKLKIKICEEYGIYDIENDLYNFSLEKTPLAQKELDDLSNIEQEINIRTIKESDLDGFDLTMAQMSAIMFMIEEDE